MPIFKKTFVPKKLIYWGHHCGGVGEMSIPCGSAGLSPGFSAFTWLMHLGKK